MKKVLRTSANFIQNGKAGAILAAALLTMTAAAKAEDTAAKPDKPTPAPVQAAPAQNNPPQTSTPPQKPAEGQPAAPAAPAATPPGTVTYSGLIDVYYGVNARAPHSPAGGGPFGKSYAGLVFPNGERFGIDNVGRSFDVNDREPSFSLGEFNITRTEGKGFPLGVTATLTLGDTARLVHATEPGGTSSWQTLQQLYLTKTIHAGGRDIAIDGGIFVSPIGIEVIESTSNDNYSRSFAFNTVRRSTMRVFAPPCPCRRNCS